MSRILLSSFALATGCAAPRGPETTAGGTTSIESGTDFGSGEDPGTTTSDEGESTGTPGSAGSSSGGESSGSESGTGAPAGCGEGSAMAAEGVWSDGNTIVICGAGFGERTHQAGPDLLEDFSDFRHAEGETVRSGEGQVFDGNTTFAYTNAAEPRFAGDVGQIVALGDAFIGNPNGELGGTAAPPAIDRIYGRFWKRFEIGPYEVENSASHKFVRLWSGDEEDLRISWTQMHLTVSNGNAGFPSAEVSWRAWEGDPTGWNLYEMLVDLETHTVHAWLNGELVHAIVDADRIVDGASGLRFAHIASFDTAHGTPEVTGQRHWTEEVYVDRSPARVVVGGFEHWSERGAGGSSTPLLEEIQRPTSWSDDRIEIVARLGALGSFRGRYLYVIDDTGSVVNEDGLPI